jgi:hypothetical protein
VIAGVEILLLGRRVDVIASDELQINVQDQKCNGFSLPKPASLKAIRNLSTSEWEM